MTPTEKAKTAVELLKEAVLEVLRTHPQGLTHAEIVKILDIPSDFKGNQKNYLSWSVLGLLINAGKITRDASKRYTLPASSAAKS